MGYYVSISLNLQSHSPPEQVTTTLCSAGIELNDANIYQQDNITHICYSACDYKYSLEDVHKLLMGLLSLDLYTTDNNPQLVFCDDLEQHVWGFHLKGEVAVPYIAKLHVDRRAEVFRKRVSAN